MKFSTAISILTANTVVPECFAVAAPKSLVHRTAAALHGNGVRTQDAAETVSTQQGTVTSQEEESQQQHFFRHDHHGRPPSAGALKNREFVHLMTQDIRTSTTTRTQVECDPTSSEAAADIGILQCESHETCLDDPESSLGGFCSEPISRVAVPFSATSRRLQLSPEDVYYWCYDAEYADWNCNCDDFDEYTYSALDCSYQYCSDCEGGNCSQDTFSTVVTYGAREWTECYDYGTWEVCLEGSVDYYTTPSTYSYDCTFQYKGQEYCCQFDQSVGDAGCGFRNCASSTLPFEICDILAACPNLDSTVPWFQPPASTPVAAPVAPPVAPPVAAPVAAPVAPPVAPPVAVPVAPPVAAPVAPPVAPPVAAPVAPPVASPVAAPVVPPVAPPVAAPVASPVASPVTPPVSSPVASTPVASPVASAPVASPVAAGAPVASPVTAAPVAPVVAGTPVESPVTAAPEAPLGPAAAGAPDESPVTASPEASSVATAAPADSPVASATPMPTPGVTVSTQSPTEASVETTFVETNRGSSATSIRLPMAALVGCLVATIVSTCVM